MSQSEFIPLICPQCSGKIEIQRTDESFVVIDDKTVMFVGINAGEKIACQHCKTEFVRTQRFSAAPVTGNVAFNQAGQTVHGTQVNITGSINTGGGAFIGGNVNTGGKDFVGRNVVIIRK